MTDFTLTSHDKSSALWVRLRAHLEDRLAAVRQQNDKLLPEPETAALRGEIKCLKSLIRLGDDRPVILTGDEQPPV